MLRTRVGAQKRRLAVVLNIISWQPSRVGRRYFLRTWELSLLITYIKIKKNAE